MLAVTAASARAVDAPPLPPQVVALAPDLTVQGGGELTFFGLSIYDGWYWSPARGWSPDGPFALDLHYHRDLDGAQIAERSVDEIAKLGLRHRRTQRARWGEAMRRMFPDVRKGDRLTGVNLPGGAVRYFHNGKPIGEIDDPEFARAFFGIWLDPRTSRTRFPAAAARRQAVSATSAAVPARPAANGARGYPALFAYGTLRHAARDGGAAALRPPAEILWRPSRRAARGARRAAARAAARRRRARSAARRVERSRARRASG